MCFLLVAVGVNFFFNYEPPQTALTADPEGILRIDPGSINWNSVAPGSSTKRYVNLTNAGNYTGILSFNATEKTPAEAWFYLFVYSNITGYSLKPQETISAEFTLNVSPSVRNIADFTISINVMLEGG